MHGSLDNLVADWTPDQRCSVDATRLWLEAYYTNADGDLVFATPHRNFWKRYCAHRLATCSLADVAAAVNGIAQLYLKINTMDLASIEARGKWAVGGNKEIVQIVSFHADIDCEKRPEYPSRALALETLHGLAIPPSMVVGSGGPTRGGLHASWLMRLPFFIGDQLDYFRAFSKRFQAYLQRALDPHQTDKLSNLERVLRVVGSVRTDGEKVALLELNRRRYDFADLLAICPDPEPQPLVQPNNPSPSTSLAANPNSERAISMYLQREGITLESLLHHYGWTTNGKREEQTIWRRPNADVNASQISGLQGVSKFGRPSIHIFSGNAGLTPDCSYDAECLFTHYRFGGDWTKAAAYCHDQLNYEHIYIQPPDPADEVSIGAWRELVAANFRETIVGLNVERSPMGIGKTATAMNVVASGDWGPTTFCCSSHANCVEIKDAFKAASTDVGLYPTVDEGNCINAADASRAMSVGLPIASTVCAECPNNVRDLFGRMQCTYHRLREAAEAHPIRIATHARLVHSTVAENSQTIVIDENALGTLRKVVALRKEDLVAAREWWKQINLQQSHGCEAICDSLIQAIDQASPVPQKVALPDSDRKTDGWHQLLWNDKKAPHQAAAAVMQLYALDFAEVGVCSTHAIVVFCCRDLGQKRIVYLDSTADVELVKRALFRRTTAGVDISLISAEPPVKDLTPSGHVAIAQRPVQIPKRDITIGKDPHPKAKAIANYIVALIGTHDYERISVIGHPKHVDHIKKYIPREFHWRLLDFFYFRQGPDRGSNYWHNTRCDCLMIAGTPRVPEDAIRDQLAAFGYWNMPVGDMVKCKVHVGEDTFITYRYADPDVQRVYEYLVTAPLLQAIGRARPLQDNVRCDTYIFSNQIIECWQPTIALPEELVRVTECVVEAAQTVLALASGSVGVHSAAVATKLCKDERNTRRYLKDACKYGLIESLSERSGYLPSGIWQQKRSPLV